MIALFSALWYTLGRTDKTEDKTMAEMRKYDDSEILSHVDHTLLRPTATTADIDRIIDEGIKYRTASVCIPPSFVAQAAAYAKGRVKICTVIGFPNGYNTTAVKVFERPPPSFIPNDTIIIFGFLSCIDCFQLLPSSAQGKSLPSVAG